MPQPTEQTIMSADEAAFLDILDSLAESIQAQRDDIREIAAIMAV
jgi:hypothetical protein